MQFPLIGGHPAIDFLNTSFTPQDQVVEAIGSGRDFLDWLVATGLIEPSVAPQLMKRFGAKALDKTAQDARKLREWTRAWLLKWRSTPEANYQDEIAKLNKWLSGAAAHHELVPREDGLRLVERTKIDGPEALLTLVALQVAGLLTQEQPSLIKSCAGAQCSLWFVDRTKAHRRVFCSATACGNRAKVAAFRQRQKE